MKLFRNRIFLSALCIAIAAAITFLLLPSFYESKNKTVTLLRASEDIPVGTKLQDKQLEAVEVGGYGLPEGILNEKNQIVGKIAQTSISKGDYLFPKKLGDYLSDEKLDGIAEKNQRLVTVSMPTLSAGLSSHLQSGDVVTVAVFIDKASGGQDASPQVVLYPELKSLEVYSVENARTQDIAKVREQQSGSQTPTGDPVPKAVTLIVTEVQAEKLIQAEYTGKLHLIFEKRGASHER